jgi:hypothetical protein
VGLEDFAGMTALCHARFVFVYLPLMVCFEIFGVDGLVVHD